MLLSGSTSRISRSAPTGTAARHGAVSSWTKALERSAPNRPGARAISRGREVVAPSASFFETLFSGGSQSSGGAREQAAELVDQLLNELGPKRNKPVIGPNEVVDDLINELGRVNVVRNPARSPTLCGVYDVRYLESQTIPPTATNPQVTMTEKEYKGQFDMSVLGVLPVKAARFAAWKATGSNTFAVSYNAQTIDKGILGKEETEISAQTNFEVLFFDERVLIHRVNAVTEDSDEERIPTTQVFVKNSKSLPEVARDEPQVKSDITPSTGLKKAARRTGAATKAERSYQQKEEAVSKKNAAAEREARQEALRLEKEKAAAEREAAQALKAEIKASVDGFNQRLKDAQESKKEATAALKAFERENAEVLKEVSAFRKEMASIDNEIASLTEEAQSLAEQEKAYADEIRNCRRELADIGKQLATF